MAAGEEVKDPEILRQLGLGGGTSAPGRRGVNVLAPPAAPPPKSTETPGGKRLEGQFTADVPTPQEYSALAASRTQIDSALNRLGRVETLYNRSLKGKEPWRVIREYFPGIAPGSQVSQDVKRLRTAGSQLFQYAAQINRIPGEGEQNYAEFMAKIEANKIQPSDNDEEIEEKISGIRDLLSRRSKMVNERLASAKPQQSSKMKAAKATVNPPKRLRYDAQGNRIP